MALIDPKREELVFLAGDQEDPIAALNPLERERSRGKGYASTIRMTEAALGHPQVRWRDRVITCDVYDKGEGLYIHLLCPKCSTPEVPHALTIRAAHKQLEYDPNTAKEIGGRLNVEAFMCTWELTTEAGGMRRDFGLSLCRWHVAIDNNIARDV